MTTTETTYKNAKQAMPKHGQEGCNVVEMLENVVVLQVQILGCSQCTYILFRRIACLMNDL
jgi:hypothetical protein